jgi:hypothetical protein
MQHVKSMQQVKSMQLVNAASAQQAERSVISSSLRGGARRATGEELPVSMVVNTGHDIRFLSLAYKSAQQVAPRQGHPAKLPKPQCPVTCDLNRRPVLPLAVCF